MEWRVVQVFLSPKGSGVYEVELTTDGSDVRCNCQSYVRRNSCRHVKFVTSKMTDGTYPIQVHHSARDEDLAEHITDPAKFRDFIIRFGKIEVV